MTYEAGIEGVTRPYTVEDGLAPVQVVWRQLIPAGANAILYWNYGGNLNPRRMRAGDNLLLPLEPLRLEVYQDVHRMGVFIGDWWVKEFRVGVGKEGSETPTGTFRVVERISNPTWTTTIKGRHVKIPPGDPRNELGSVWIELRNAEYSSGNIRHPRTVRPETVGTHCSSGCVRLHNVEAEEVRHWVRRVGGPADEGVPATRVRIYLD